MLLTVALFLHEGAGFLSIELCAARVTYVNLKLITSKYTV